MTDTPAVGTYAAALVASGHLVSHVTGCAYCCRAEVKDDDIPRLCRVGANFWRQWTLAIEERRALRVEDPDMTPAELGG